MLSSEKNAAGLISVENTFIYYTVDNFDIKICLICLCLVTQLAFAGPCAELSPPMCHTRKRWFSHL